MSKVIILGSGMAGFGAVHRLHTEGKNSVLYEKKPYYGGHTATFENDAGFIFDDGPHISFTKVERLQKLFAANVDQKYEIIQARVNNYWKGHWIKHPAQCNLHGLPEELVVSALSDFIQAQFKDHEEIKNYQDWLVASYGKKFAETFPMEYGLKYHTTTANNMSTDWLGPRLYRPEIKEVLHGALSASTPDVHYVNHFRYPSKGGFVAYLKPFIDQTDLRLDHEVIRIEPITKELHFAKGVVDNYDSLISSIPLPELISMISGAPEDVIESAQKLACTICVVVNIGLNREDVSDATWTYFYDQDFFFTRLSFPHRLCPNTVPPGASSIQAEVYYSEKYRPLDRSPNDCIQPVIKDLKRCGLILENDEILCAEARLIPYANVIFDLDRADSLATVHGYLEDVGINYCGRYGDWEYHWTDESFMSGENAAQKVLDNIAQ